MAVRQISLGTFLLVACAFLAGRAFPQAGLPGESLIQPQEPTPAAPNPDPFAIPMPPELFRGKAETAPAPSTRGVTPMKYFVPVTKDPSGAGLDGLRERFTQVVAERAAIMSADELQTEISAIEKVLREFTARQALERSVKSLEAVISEYSETEAAKDAQRAVDLLKSKPGETRRAL